MITDYQSLQDEIALWVPSVPPAAIPTIIQLAETSLLRNIRMMYLEAQTTLQTVAGQETVDLPVDYNGIHRLSLQTNPPVELTQIAAAELSEQSQLKPSGRPYYYAISQNKLFLRPVPDSVYDLDLTYYAFPRLSDSNTTNEILTRYPDCYLYSSLVCTEGYMYNDDRMPTWKRLADEAIKLTIDQDIDLRFGKTPLQMRVY